MRFLLILLFFPSDLAYGDAGSGDIIPPGATLKIEVELFKVNYGINDNGENVKAYSDEVKADFSVSAGATLSPR